MKSASTFETVAMSGSHLIDGAFLRSVIVLTKEGSSPAQLGDYLADTLFASSRSLSVEMRKNVLHENNSPHQQRCLSLRPVCYCACSNDRKTGAKVPTT